MSRAIFRTGLIALAMAPLGACVSVLPEPPDPPRIYTLTAATPAETGAMVAPIVISVAAPNGARAVMGADLVWRRDGVIAYVEAAEWAGRTPDLLQSLLADTIDSQGLVRAGVRSGAGVRADYEIQWDIAAFEIREADGARTAHFAGAARLVEGRTRELIASARFDNSEPLEERSSGAAAAALESLARDAASRIARQLSTAAADHASAASINR